MTLSKKIIPAFALLLLVLNSCSKSNYKDGGVIDPKFPGTTMEYLKAKPENFDSLTKIIKLAGLEDVLQNEQVTFFAPPDPTIKLTIRLMNVILDRSGRDTIYKMEQIKPEVWKKALSYYIFKQKKGMNDYPQVDFANIPVFPGQPYTSWAGKIMNIGVNYGDADGVEYAGSRMLYLSYIQSESDPRSGWISSMVATSNIDTKNGYIHALRYAITGSIISSDALLNLDIATHFFGFDPIEFVNDAVDKGIAP